MSSTDGDSLSYAQDRHNRLKGYVESLKKRVLPTEQMLDWKEEIAKKKSSETIRRISDVLKDMDKTLHDQIDRARQDQSAEVQNLKMELDAYIQFEKELGNNITEAHAAGCDAQMLMQMGDQAESQRLSLCGLQVQEKLQSIQNFEFAMHKAFFDMESALRSHSSLFFVKTCMIVPSDVTLFLHTSMPKPGAPVQAEIRPNASDPRYRSLLTVRIVDFSGNNLAPMIEGPLGPASVCTLTFLPTVSGQHTINVFLYDEPIANSPMTLMVSDSNVFQSSLPVERPMPLSPQLPDSSQYGFNGSKRPSPLVSPIARTLADSSTESLDQNLSNGPLSVGRGSTAPRGRAHLRGVGASMTHRQTTAERLQAVSKPWENHIDTPTAENAAVSESNAVEELTNHFAHTDIRTDTNPPVSRPSVIRGRGLLNNFGNRPSAEEDPWDELDDVHILPMATAAVAQNAGNVANADDDSWDRETEATPVKQDTPQQSTFTRPAQAYQPNVNGNDENWDEPSPARARPIASGGAASNAALPVVGHLVDVDAPLAAPYNCKPDLAAMLAESGGKGIRGTRMLILGVMGKNEPKTECLSFPLGCRYDSENNEWMVCDAKHDAVKIYSHGGDPLQLIPDNWRKELHQPSAVVPLANKGGLLVKDDRGLYLYSRKGELVKDIAKMARPMGLAVDGNNRVITLANANTGACAQIHVFDMKGEMLEKFEFSPMKQLTDEERQKSQPRFLDASGDQLAVTDLGLNKVFIISLKDGQHLSTFGKFGNAPGDFTYVSGIQIDSAGNYLIGDAKGNRVQLFDKTGKFLCVITLDTPGSPFVSDICLTDEGYLMVSLRRRHAIVIYKLEPMT